MPIQLTRRNVSAIAKSIRGDMKHTHKLDAIANALGYKDQASLMSTLKAAETDAGASLGQVSALSLDDRIHATAMRRMRSIAGTDLDRFTSGTWRYEVENGDTGLGFDAWREHQIEMAADDCLSAMRLALWHTDHALNDNSPSEGRKASDLAVYAIEDAISSVLVEEVEAETLIWEGPFNKAANEHLYRLHSSLRGAPEVIEGDLRAKIEDAVSGLRSDVSPDAEMPDPLLGEAVAASAWSDDHRVEAHFDARPFLVKATASQIKELVENDFRCCYAADDLFYSAEDAGDEDAGRLRTYLDTKPTMASGDPVGFEAEISADDMREWLGKYRPDLAVLMEDDSPDP